MADADLDLERGHVLYVSTFIGDFDYEAAHAGLPALCTECRYELGKPVDESVVERVSVRLVPRDEWPP